MLIRDELTVCRWEGAWVGGNWVRLFIFLLRKGKRGTVLNITIILIAHYSFPPCPVQDARIGGGEKTPSL